MRSKSDLNSSSTSKMSSTSQPKKERLQKTSDESKSVPGSPKLENKRLTNQRRQFQSNHSGSSSECPTRKSTENLNSCGDDDQDRTFRPNPMAVASGGSTINVNGRRSSALQQVVTENLNPAIPITLPQPMSSVMAEESDSDFGQNQPSTSNSRSRQKKFLKTFKHLPPEEIVLQRYSCALVSDILLQGHLYITQNYFAFYSNVFGYVTKLQIPIRSVTKLSKEKTAKIIPNAVGLCTEEGKHIFSSLLSRDSTFKLMNRLWTRAMKNLPPEILVVTQENALETELDYEEEFVQDDELSSDSDGAMVAIDDPGAKDDPMDSSYLVKRMSQSSSSLFYQQQSLTTNRSPQPRKTIYGSDSVDFFRRSSSAAPPSGNSSSHMNRSTLLSLLVIILLIFLVCSSVYLVFRVDALQKQVESRYMRKHLDMDSILSRHSGTHEVQDALDSNVEQISTVRKSLEKISDLISSAKKEA